MDNFSITSTAVMDRGASLELDQEQWRDYLMKAKVKDDAEKNEKVQFLLDHAVKSKDLLYFAHCYFFGRTPCRHCAPIEPSTMLREITEKFGRIPVPVLSSINPGTFHLLFRFVFLRIGHYLSYLECSTATDFSNAAPRCDLHYYEFDSNADMRRHFDLCHGGEPTESFCVDYFVCERIKRGKQCKYKCDSLEELNEHVAANHRVRKPKSQSISFKKKRITDEAVPETRLSKKKSKTENNSKKVDVYHGDGLWYCGEVRNSFEKTCEVHFCDGDDGLRVKYRDILDCIHDPQLKVGSDRGLPAYLS